MDNPTQEVSEQQPIQSEIPFQQSGNSNWRKTLNIGLGIVGISIVIGIGGFILGIRNTKTNVVRSATPTITQVFPTPTPDSTVNWKTYRNNGYGFEFKYPQSISNAQGNNESFTVYFQGSPDYPYSIILSVVKEEKSFDGYLDELYKKRGSYKKGKALIIGSKPAFQDNISDNQTSQLETFIDGTPKIIVQMVVLTNKKGNIETLQQINNQILSTFKFIDQN